MFYSARDATVPLFPALQNVTSPYAAAFALVMRALLIVSFYTSITGS